MKKVYKIYQTNFPSEHEHDFFLKMDDREYSSVADAETVLQRYFDDTREIDEEFIVLPVYIKE